MKLRHKETGEIRELTIYAEKFHLDDIGFAKGETIVYNSLTELNEEWEDYEEPKEYWFITDIGQVCKRFNDSGESWDKFRNETGNYFETKEEAEKAVEKLKAWERLKDKGFRFVGRSIRDLTITYSFDNYDEPDIPQMNKDLDLLFGGEE
ncbi:hypothetical protein IIZ77_01155 [Candidatus Saccharibacteria bacterium]|nr:hypothetical protein [Candidatus Saccharibacteria bacterium]